MGKTALATNMAFNAAYAHMKSEGKEGGQVAFFSLEMSSEQLATRILAERTEISGDRIRRGDLREDDFPKFVAAAQDLHRIPFFIDDAPALTVSGLRTRSRRLKRPQGLGMIVIDYLHTRGPKAGAPRRNRAQG